MELNWYDVLILAMAAPLILLPVVYAWWLFVWGGVYHPIRRERRLQKARRGELVCSIDRNCPKGYVCVDGKCVSAT